MANSISELSLNEIYSLSTEEKLNLIDLILKSIKSAVAIVKSNDDVKSSSWVDEFEGMWSDDNNADEMVDSIRTARTTNRSVEL